MASKSPRIDNSRSPKWLTAGLFESFWAMCTQRRSKKPHNNSVLSRPRQLLATISHKAIMLRQKRKAKQEFENIEGVWQRSILMGDKCEPLDFSGVIYYDNDGKRLTQLPMRSPRASPLPSYAYKSPRSTADSYDHLTVS